MGTKLGQNFLKHPEIGEKIVKAAEIATRDTIIEIGPGRGILTAELLKRAARVIAIEKDEKLADFLVAKFAAEIAANKLIIIRGDALKIIWIIQGLPLDKYKVVANIPYYITGQIIRKFLEAKARPSSMTLLVQKEVAERIVAKPPHMNLLAISVQCYGTPKIAFKVSRASFSPPPNVDSAVITISDISRNFFRHHKITEADFFALIHAGFAHPRKQLAGNLSKGSPWIIQGLPLEKAVKLLASCNILPITRAENLSLADWAHLTQKLINVQTLQG